MITAEQKKKWVEALRSGEYEQAAGMLRNSKGYCCLGVAAEVIGNGLELDPTGTARYQTIGPCAANEDASFAIWFGHASSEQRCVMSDAMSMNDRGNTFLEIADFLEENLMVEE